MSRSPRDDRTGDLLAWTPPSVVPQVDPEVVRADRLRDQVARAVSLMLKECGLPRDEVAERMGEFLGETVSKASLDTYASQAREDTTISAIRLVALCHATRDMRAFQVLVEPFDYAVVPARYVPAIEEAMIRAKIKELTTEADLKQRQWRGPRP